MLELPEAAVLADQVTRLAAGRTIDTVEAGHSPHKWAWFNGDPAEYPRRLEGKSIQSATSWGGIVDVEAEDVHLYFGDGVSLRLFQSTEKLPAKHQLKVGLDDGSVLLASVQMYGGLWACPEGEVPNKFLTAAMEKPSPLSDAFSEAYFESLFSEAGERMSLKGFLATEQRIPGLGNGVLQDILFQARLHPKKKLNTVSDDQRQSLYRAVTETLKTMVRRGGRDTEKLLDGKPGGYRTLLSRNTLGTPCTVCEGTIDKATYLGGSVYFCPHCQEL